MTEGTRSRIIVATNELFRRQGYNGTSLSQISAAAPATIGSIYHFFPGGKQALAAAVIETTGAAYRDLFVTIVSGHTEAIAGFGAFFEGGALVLREMDFIDPCPIGTVAREVASTNETLRVAAAAVFDSWIQAAKEFLERCGADPTAAADLAMLFVTAVEGCFVVCRTQRSTQPIEAVARMITPLVASVMTPPERAGHRGPR